MNKVTRSALIALLALGLAPLKAQELLVPRIISEAFAKKYPQGEDVMWEELDEAYIASFLNGDYYSDAYFDKMGKWLETSTIIDEADVPPSVVAGVKAKYNNYDYFTSLVRSDRPDNTWYFLGFEKGTDFITLTLDQKGVIVNEEVESFDGDE